MLLNGQCEHGRHTLQLVRKTRKLPKYRGESQNTFSTTWRIDRRVWEERNAGHREKTECVGREDTGHGIHALKPPSKLKGQALIELQHHIRRESLEEPPDLWLLSSMVHSATVQEYGLS